MNALDQGIGETFGNLPHLKFVQLALQESDLRVVDILLRFLKLNFKKIFDAFAHSMRDIVGDSGKKADLNGIGPIKVWIDIRRSNGEVFKEWVGKHRADLLALGS